MILDFGHIFMELVMDIQDTPSKGKPLKARQYALRPSGRALHQAIAAARSGAKVSLSGSIGDDIFGKEILAALTREGIAATGISRQNLPTGIQSSITTPKSDRLDVFADGANAMTASSQIPDTQFNHKALLLLQDDLEDAECTNLFERAKERQTVTIMHMTRPSTKPAFWNDVDFVLLRGGDEPLTFATDKAPSIIRLPSAKEKSVRLYTPGQAGISLSLLNHDIPLNDPFAQDCFAGSFSACVQAKMPLPFALKHAVASFILAAKKSKLQDRFSYLDDIEKLAKTLPEPTEMKQALTG